MNQIEDKRKIRQISSIGQIFAPEITRTISYIRASAARQPPSPSPRRKTNAVSVHRKKRRRNEFRAPKTKKYEKKIEKRISESEAKVEKITQSAKLFCRKTPDRSRTRASRARPRLNNWRTEGALSPIASAISAELHPSACSSTTLRDSVPNAESARDHRASSTRA